MLARSDFQQLVAHAPLVSIDLVLHNRQGQYLLGLRTNRPAQGFWFVPGGRIYKNEPLAQAFARLTQVELGQSFDIAQARLLGAYDHFYSDSVFGDEPSTHYVALGYSLLVPDTLNLPPDQHSQYQWLTRDQLLAHPMVHANTKAYLA